MGLSFIPNHLLVDLEAGGLWWFWVGDGKKLPTMETVYSSQFKVTDTDGITIQGKGFRRAGCPHKGRNSCELDTDRPDIDIINAGVAQLLKRCGNIVCKTGDVLVMFEAIGLRGPPRKPAG